MDRDQVLFRLFGKFCTQGTILTTEGATGEGLYFVQSGAVHVGPDGLGDPGGARGPGSILGEEAFFARAARTRRAEVVQDCRLLQINDRNLDAVVRHGPDAALALLERLVTAEVRSRADRDARWLARTARRAVPFLPQERGASITPAALAENAGVDAEDARRLLLELERLGAAVPGEAAWRFPDPGLLGRAAGEILAAGGEA